MYSGMKIKKNEIVMFVDCYTYTVLMQF